MNTTPTRREIPGYKAFRHLNTGPVGQIEIPLYSKAIRNMRISNITAVAQTFGLYILEDEHLTNIPPIIGERFYITPDLVVPPGVSLEYNADSINLRPNTQLMIEVFQPNAFSIIYRLD